MTDIVGNLGQQRLAGSRARHRHLWQRATPAMLEDGDDVDWCLGCYAKRDPDKSRRSRNNRKRGNAIQLRIATDAGLSNIGPLGLPEDAGTSTEWLRLQVKSGLGYPKLLDRWLRAISATPEQLRGVVYVETPGPGRKAKRMIVLDYDEFLDWFGE